MSHRMSFLVPLLGTMTAAVLVACGGGDDEEEPPPPVSTLAPAATATTVPPTVTPRPTATPEPSPTPEPTATPPPQQDPVELGMSLAARNGCSTCHSNTGAAGIGPTWKGLYGMQETLSDGSTVPVDDEYLRVAIVDPDAQVVQGFIAGIMPGDFGDKLTDDQINAIIEYIKSLR